METRRGMINLNIGTLAASIAKSDAVKMITHSVQEEKRKILRDYRIFFSSGRSRARNTYRGRYNPNGARECARRVRQIAAGQLAFSNGLRAE